ncbi:MAG: cytidylate kinase-like family protein [Desulfobacteraceae bacterium]|jgi:cytidylate kinase
MLENKNKQKPVPGTYAKQRPSVVQLVDRYIWDRERRRLKMKATKIEPAQIEPTICFSRKIGAGALEIADILAEKLDFRVVDRELLDHMAKEKEISKETIEFFDERYPGKMSELACMLFCEKSFIMSDYMRNAISAVFTFADMGSTIFVGRGIHLILPRDRVLAVRMICSDQYRIERLGKMLDVEENEAEKLLGQSDKEQRAFFKKVFGKKDASPYEFDLVINCEFISDPHGVAEIIAQAFNQKFVEELDQKESTVRVAV